MEPEILETVLTEVLGELREVKQLQAEQAGALTVLAEKVQDFESKLSSIKISPPPVNTIELEMSIADGIDKIKSAIDAQPKSIIKRWQVLLFPDYHREEYYKIVFGRVFLWLMVFVAVTYLYKLGKQYIDNSALVGQNSNNHYKNAWQYLYNHQSKNEKKKMEAAWWKANH